MRLPLKISGKSDKGKKRKNNEDYFFVESELGLMIVADGMGGHQSGEVASKLATDLCTEQLKRSLQTGHVPVFIHVNPKSEFDKRTLLLGDCVKFSNVAVHEAAQNNPAHKSMGTTLVAALWLDDKLAVAHVGDSRLYRIRNGDISQCTMDHTFIQEQINKGLIYPEDAEKSEMKNMLLRSVGIEEDVEVDLIEVELEPNDYVLLCSDGLTKMLSDDQIIKFFEKESDPQKIVDALINEANNKGGLDNVTAVVGKLEGGSPSWGSFGDRIKTLFKNKMEKK
jgi:protein phosphatase